ncbi:unnamed protein product [Diabrotica balteata]|uniref:TLC domain-containing protein n=1 Tax=Diabrotica balteata TaxID=107213 RepID=A0A9N9SXT9_DIABA|nr:unnamed protein product [Diabrotica balteata]
MEPNYLQIEDQQSNKYHPIVPFLAVAVPFLLVKFVISEFVVKKIAIHFGLNKGNDRRKSSKSLNGERTLSQNERKKASSQNKYSNFDKFCESANKFVWYTFIWIYGLIMHWNKPWLWDIESCWTDFGHGYTLDVWYYGVFLTAYYLEACTMYFVRVRRKDFMIMLIHHICLMGIVAVVWYYGLYAIGVLDMFLHDFADIFMELAKCVKYLKFTVITNVLFALFVVSWIVTRMYLFPMYVVRSGLEDRYGVLRKISLYYYWNGISLVLMCLHTIWTYMILRAVVRAIRTGVAEDDRSDDEDDIKDEQKKE